MNLKKFAELDTTNRGAPCQEYPGAWLICIPDALGSYWTRFWMSKERRHSGHSHATFEVAKVIGEAFLNYLEEQHVEYNPRDITICWKCSDYDQRMGQAWFTGFYQHGRFNLFGSYVSV